MNLRETWDSMAWGLPTDAPLDSIQRLRELGFPIASDDRGCWKSVSSSALAETAQRLMAIGDETGGRHLLDRLFEGPMLPVYYESMANDVLGESEGES